MKLKKTTKAIIINKLNKLWNKKNPWRVSNSIITNGDTNLWNFPLLLYWNIWSGDFFFHPNHPSILQQCTLGRHLEVRKERKLSGTERVSGLCIEKGSVILILLLRFEWYFVPHFTKSLNLPSCGSSGNVKHIISHLISASSCNSQLDTAAEKNM